MNSFLFQVYALLLILSNQSYAQPVDDFTLITHQDELITLSTQTNAKAVVLISYGIGCPIIRRNIPTVQKLVEKYKEQDIRFYFIDANMQDSREKLIKEAKTYQVQIPFLIDSTQIVSKSLGMDRTGMALVIDPKRREIIFRGPIDDRLSYAVDNLKASEAPLETALTELVSGKKISKSDAKVFGCAITFEDPKVFDYHNKVAPIIFNKCAQCHKPGGVEPTNFWSYPELKSWGKMLKEVLVTEQMPLWEAHNFYYKLKHDLSLTVEQKKIIYAWVDNGFPEGKKQKKEKYDFSKFSLDIKGDFSWPMKEEITLEADSKTPWHYEEIVAPADSDLWISGLGYESNNNTIVGHISLIVTKKPMDLSQNIFEPFRNSFDTLYSIIRLSNQANKPTRLDGRYAYRIPKDHHVYLEVHMNPTGKTEKIKATAHLRKYKGKESPIEIKYDLVSFRNLKIPAKTEKYTVSAVKNFDKDVSIVSMGLHQHLRGTSVKVTHVYEGKSNVVYASRFLFKTRSMNTFAKPLLVRKGSQLIAEFTYNNSPSNPANIDWHKDVLWGVDPFEHEMALLILLLYDMRCK